MAQETPNTATVGKINVAVGGELSGLKTALAEGEAATKASAAKMQATMGKAAAATKTAAGGSAGFGMGKGPGVSSIGAANAAAVAASTGQIADNMGRAETRAQGLFATMGNIRRIASRLFLPALLISQITRMAKAFDELRRGAEAFQQALKDTASGPAAELLRTLREVRVTQGRLTEGQIVEMETRERGRALEIEINAQYQQRLIHLNTLAGVLEGLATGRTGIKMMAEAEKEYNAQLALTRSQTEELVRLQKLLRREMEEQERIQRRMREQAKRDITHMTIDPRRIGPALDLLQRQRTAG